MCTRILQSLHPAQSTGKTSYVFSRSLVQGLKNEFTSSLSRRRPGLCLPSTTDQRTFELSHPYCFALPSCQGMCTYDTFTVLTIFLHAQEGSHLYLSGIHVYPRYTFSFFFLQNHFPCVWLGKSWWRLPGTSDAPSSFLCVSNLWNTLYPNCTYKRNLLLS